MKIINRYKNAFTLIEILAVLILLGLAIAAVVGSNAAITQSTAMTVQLSTSEFLIEQIRELSAIMPIRDPLSGAAYFGPEPSETGIALFDDVDDFDGFISSPPVDSQRRLLSDYSDYKQTVTVENVSPTNFQTVVADNSSDFVRVTVKVYYKNSEIAKMSWIRALNK